MHMYGRGILLTFSPPPHSDAVLAVESHREEQFPVAAEVDAGHTHRVGTLQDGERLLGMAVPHVNGGRLPKLTGGHDLAEFVVAVECDADDVIVVL